MALIQARMSSRGTNSALKQRGINNEMMRHEPSEDDAQGGELRFKDVDKQRLNHFI